MGLRERVGQELAAYQTRDIDMPDATLSLDQWAEMFQFGGLTYPVVNTSMGNIKEERIAQHANGAFRGNSTVFSLVVDRIQVFSQVRFQWTRFTGSLPGDLFGTPDLKVLENPWPGGFTPHLLARMELDNSLCGNAFIVRPRPDRLARLRPDFVHIVLGSQMDADYPADAPDVEIAGYAYLPRSGNHHFFFPNEVAHFAPIPDPDFQFLGMSWVGACIRELQADSLMTEHKARFMQNAATPNLAIKFDPAVGIDMVRQFKALMEEEHKGVWNAYKTLYLGGGADPVTVGKDFRQLDFAVVQGHGETKLAAAAGVPPSWAGFSEGLQGSTLNAGNFDSSRRRFADGTMSHLWAAAATSLQSIVPPRYSTVSSENSGGATLWYDTRVPFMREDAADLAKIQVDQSQVISVLVQQGFEPDSVVHAVADNDWSLLTHSGLVSVQLLPPGAAIGPGKPGTQLDNTASAVQQNGSSAATVSGNGGPK